MSRMSLILVAAGGSAALLGGAFLFQALGYPPCALCIWQRWPHGAAMALGLLSLVLPAALLRPLSLLGAAAAAATAGIGLYHAGIERGWWQGPASCTSAGTGLGGLSGGELLSTDGPALVLCDQISWSFLGLSMAAWNALISAVLVLVWIAAARARG